MCEKLLETQLVTFLPHTRVSAHTFTHTRVSAHTFTHMRALTHTKVYSDRLELVVFNKQTQQLTFAAVLASKALALLC